MAHAVSYPRRRHHRATIAACETPAAASRASMTRRQATPSGEISPWRCGGAGDGPDLAVASMSPPAGAVINLSGTWQLPPTPEHRITIHANRNAVPAMIITRDHTGREPSDARLVPRPCGDCRHESRRFTRQLHHLGEGCPAEGASYRQRSLVTGSIEGWPGLFGPCGPVEKRRQIPRRAQADRTLETEQAKKITSTVPTKIDCKRVRTPRGLPTRRDSRSSDRDALVAARQVRDLDPPAVARGKRLGEAKASLGRILSS